MFEQAFKNIDDILRKEACCRPARGPSGADPMEVPKGGQLRDTGSRAALNLTEAMRTGPPTFGCLGSSILRAPPHTLRPSGLRRKG